MKKPKTTLDEGSPLDNAQDDTKSSSRLSSPTSPNNTNNSGNSSNNKSTTLKKKVQVVVDNNNSNNPVSEATPVPTISIPLDSSSGKVRHHLPFKKNEKRNNSVNSFSSVSPSPSTPSTAGSINSTVNSSISHNNSRFVNTNFTFGSSGSLSGHSPAHIPSSTSMASTSADTQSGHFSMPVGQSFQNLSVDTSRHGFLPATKLTGTSNSSFGSLINGISSQNRIPTTPGSVLSIRSVGSNTFVPSPGANKQISSIAMSSSVSFSKVNLMIEPVVAESTKYYHEEEKDDLGNGESPSFKEVDLNQQDLTSDDDDGSSHRDSIDTNRKSVDLLLKDMPTATSKNNDFYREQLWRHFTKTNIAFGVFNLINDVISPATISSGYTVAQSGIGAYILTLLLLSGLVFFTLIILYDMANAQKVTSFPSLIKKTFGNIGYILICVFIFLFNFGGICSELIEISQILPDLLHELIGKESAFISRYAVLVYVTVILLPIASMKQISSFKYASLVSVTCVAIISLLLTYELGLGRRKVPYNDSVFDFIRPQYLSGIGTLSFVFVCHDVSFEVIGSLKNNTKKRYMILVFCMLTLAVAVLLFMGLSSFFLFFDVNLKDANVLDLLPKNYGLAILARILLCISLGLSISYTCFMPRFALKSVIKTILKQFDEIKEQKEKYKTKPFTNEPADEATVIEISKVRLGSYEEDTSSNADTSSTSENTKQKHTLLSKISRFFATRTGKDTLHYGTTLFVVLSAFGVAMLIENLGVIIGLTGAISATTIAYIFPSLAYIILERRERKELMAKLLEKQDYEMMKNIKEGKFMSGSEKNLTLPWTRRVTLVMCYFVLVIGFAVLVSSLTSIIYYAVSTN